MILDETTQKSSDVEARANRVTSVTGQDGRLVGQKRLLFIHVAKGWTAEYYKHRRLAEYAGFATLSPYFVWQQADSHAKLRSKVRAENSWILEEERNRFVEFGRDLSISPKPPRVQRAAMMLRHIPHAMREIDSYLRQVKPDAIYTAQQGIDCMVANHFAKKYRIPHIIHIGYPVGPWLGRAAVRIIRNCPYLIAGSNYVRRTAIENGVAEDQIVTIHNSADISSYGLPRDRAYLTREFGYTESDLVLVVSGRLDPGKGVDVAIKAFARVAGELPQLKMLVCGDTFSRNAYDRYLDRLTNQLGVTDRVKFAGFRDDMPKIYAGSDIFCLPTLHEAFANVFTEAMASRLPVVTVNSGGNPEIVDHDDSGLVARPDDDVEIGAFIRRLSLDADLRRSMGERGREIVSDRFNPDRISEKWLHTVDAMVPSRSGNPFK